MKHSLVLVAALAACGPVTAPEVARLSAAPPQAPAEGSAPAPLGAAPGTCWAEDHDELSFELVAAERGARAVPRGSGSRLIETPCAEAMTADLIASLQRALAARGVHDGDVTGAMDDATRQALRTWQAARGLDSGLLAMVTAKELGLIAYGRPDAAPERRVEPGQIY